MSKSAQDPDELGMQAKAIAKNIRISPQKLNLIAQMIRGKKVNDAISDLEFSRKRTAQDVRKCVMSAIANAENNHGLDIDELVVAEAYVGKNLVMKRFAARGRGRGFSILKPFSQITVVLKQVLKETPTKKQKKVSKEEDVSKKSSKPKKQTGQARKRAA
ncbi:MAG: 50S ribosomal protein L22 [Hyphomicrobium sp.]